MTGTDKYEQHDHNNRNYWHMAIDLTGASIPTITTDSILFN
jgi:hypothetical protein